MPDQNRWATLSACIYGDNGIKTYYPSFDSYVSGGLLAYVSAKITSSGDTLTLGGKSQAVIRRVATPLQQLRCRRPGSSSADRGALAYREEIVDAHPRAILWRG